MNTLLLVVALSSFAVDLQTIAARKAAVRDSLTREAYQPAADEAKAINRLWPDDIETYQLMAEAQLELGDHDDADRSLQWMLDLRIGKADAKGYRLLARFREVTGDVDGAIEALNLAFGQLRAGDTAERTSLLAYSIRLHTAAGKLKVAERIAKESDPGNAEVAAARAQLLLAQGKREESIAAWRELIAKTADPRHRYALAAVTQSAADYEAFERAATGAAVGAPRELTLYLAGPGKRPGEALVIARREAKKRHDIMTQDALAFALAANGQQEEARLMMRGILDIGTLDPLVVAHAAALGMKVE